MVKGDLLLASADVDTAEPWFQKAFEIGGEVEARMTQLRAATRVTRLRRAAGKQPDGAEMLRSVYETFTEGFGTPDLLGARALLDLIVTDVTGSTAGVASGAEDA